MLRVTLQSSRLHGLTVSLPALALAAAPVCSIRTATRFAARHHITATCPCASAASTCASSSSRAIVSSTAVQRRGASEKKSEKKMNFGGADDVPVANPEPADGAMRTVIRFVVILGLVSVLPRLPAAAAVFYLYAMPSTTPQWQKDAALMMTVYPPPAPELVPSHVITFANLPADIVATHKVVVGARIVSPAVAGVDTTAAEAEPEALEVESEVGTVTVELPPELFATKGAKGALKKLALPQGAEVNAVVTLQDSAGTTVLEKTVKFPVTAQMRVLRKE